MEVFVVTGENGEQESWVQSVHATQGLADAEAQRLKSSPPMYGGPYDYWVQDYAVQTLP